MTKFKANHGLGIGQSSSMIIGHRGFRQRHLDARQAQASGSVSRITHKINMTDSRQTSNIYGTIGGGTGNIINLSKSLENHNGNFAVDRRYTESMQNYKKKEKQNRELI